LLAHDLLVKADALHALRHDDQALRSADEGVAIYQSLAADNPAKYAPNLARAIYTQSHRMASVGQPAEAISAIQTTIRLFRNLAITEPDENLPLAAQALSCVAGWLADTDDDTDALAAAHEAASIYWRKPPADELPCMRHELRCSKDDCCAGKAATAGLPGRSRAAGSWRRTSSSTSPSAPRPQRSGRPTAPTPTSSRAPGRPRPGTNHPTG
jgi:hypothetical protein